VDWIVAVTLGIVQGLTEFLPVSSSGHLVIFQHLFGLQEPELLFDVSVHMGTLVAVLAVFYRDIRALITTLFRIPAKARTAGGVKLLYAENESVRLMAMIVAGSVPTAILGLFFANIAEQLFGTLSLVGLALCITGTFLWFTRLSPGQGRGTGSMRFRDAFIIGVVQGLAIIPGISRSGATISAALYLGIDRDLAGRFSFLLSRPAIIGALVLGLDNDAFHTTLPVSLILAGSLSAALIGYLALRLLMVMVRSGRMYRFAPYCWIIGTAAMLIK
jgi:undecaprenyl-diphosphatase